MLESIHLGWTTSHNSVRLIVSGQINCRIRNKNFINAAIEANGSYRWKDVFGIRRVASKVNLIRCVQMFYASLNFALSYYFIINLQDT